MQTIDSREQAKVMKSPLNLWIINTNPRFFCWLLRWLKKSEYEITSHGQRGASCDKTRKLLIHGRQWMLLVQSKFTQPNSITNDSDFHIFQNSNKNKFHLSLVVSRFQCLSFLIHSPSALMFVLVAITTAKGTNKWKKLTHIVLTQLAAFCQEERTSNMEAHVDAFA